MRRAMYNAEVGDSMYGEDKTVSRLEEAVAGLLGKEAGLFGPSGACVVCRRLLVQAAACMWGRAGLPFVTFACLLLFSGTMTNLLALAAHCRRGDEIILGHSNHVFNYEVRAPL